MKIQKEYSYQNSVVKFLARIIDSFGFIFFNPKEKNKPINRESIRKILVVKLDHLGDGFIILPLIEGLKEIFKESKIDVLIPSWTQEIYQFNPTINEIIIYDYFRTSRQPKRKFNFSETVRLIKNLKREKYDLFIDARGEPFVAFLGFLSRARCQIGFIGDEFGSFFYTHFLSYDKKNYEGNRYLNILKIFDSKKELTKSKLYLTKNEKEKVDEIIKSHFKNKIIVLHLSSGLPYKIWPIENFAKLINKINKNYPFFEFAVLGNKNDKIYAENLKKITENEIKDLTDLFNIRETYYFLSKCSLFIGNDSVLAHFVASLDILTIDIINSAIGEPSRWKPKGENVFLIEGKDPNHYCQRDHCPYPCPNMKAISVEEVFEKCENIIS